MVAPLVMRNLSVFSYTYDHRVGMWPGVVPGGPRAPPTTPCPGPAERVRRRGERVPAWTQQTWSPRYRHDTLAATSGGWSPEKPPRLLGSDVISRTWSPVAHGTHVAEADLVHRARLEGLGCA